MKHKVLLLAGPTGSGKTTASNFFRDHDYPVIRMGTITDTYIRQSGGNISENKESEIREKLRTQFGQEAYAKLTLPLILKKLKQKTVIVDGVRSIEELRFFKSRLKNVFLLYLLAGKNKRYERLAKRTVRPLTQQEAVSRDRYELYKIGLAKLKNHADVIIENKSTRAQFINQLQEVLRMINL